MKLLRFSLVVFLMVSLAYGAGSPVVESRTEMDIDGAKAEIVRDSYGVPHIKAQTERAVYFANGYAIAQDRLVQMDRFRHAARGELAELVGSGAVSADREIRIEGYSDEERDQTFKALPQRFQDVLTAYADGINRWIDEAGAQNKLPSAFALFGGKPRPWSVRDTIAIAEMMARRFGSGGGGELRNQRLLAYLKNRFKDEHKAMQVFDDLLFKNDPSSPTTIKGRSGKGTEERKANATEGWANASSAANLDRAIDILESRDYQRIARDLGLPTKFGSYAILIAPQRSASGNPILVGGPQMGFTTPQIAHEVHLKCPDLNVIGMGFGGVPGVLIGHNEHLAWTTTSGITDMEDVFVETLNPDNPHQYRHNRQWHEMEHRVETIRVRGGQPVMLDVYRTVHGPIIEVDATNHRAYAQGYSFWKREMSALEAIYRFNRARNIKEFGSACPLIATTHNFLCATGDGDIGYWHCGQPPVRTDKVDTRLPTPGTGEYDWIGTLPFEKMPQVTDPKWHYLVNWNNKPAPWWDIDDTPAWGEIFRIHRINELIESKPKLTFEDVRDIVVDIGTNDQAADYFVPLIVSSLRKSKNADPQVNHVAQLLESWNRHSSDGSIPKSIFEAWLINARRVIFADDLGDFGDRALFDRAVQPSIILRALRGKRAKLPFRFDYLNGKSRDETILEITKQTIDTLRKQFGDDMLQWRWRQPEIRFASLPPIPQTDRGTYIQIVELGKSSIRGISILPPGQNENTSSSHYNDQRELAGRWGFKEMVIGEW